MSRTWSKTYPTAAAAEAAAHHHAWISGVGRLPIPDLLGHDGDALVFTHVPGRHVTPSDLTAVARTLARFHIEARRHLTGARMNEPYQTGSGVVIPGFTEHREQRLLDLLAAPSPPDTTLTAEGVTTWMTHAADLPPAVYKDANVRNFLITPTVVAVDFDALTLAPLGYDLAKLVVSAAMTYGPLDPALITEALIEYNRLLTGAELPACTNRHFAAWVEMHHILTVPYLGRNGYRFTWSHPPAP